MSLINILFYNFPRGDLAVSQQELGQCFTILSIISVIDHLKTGLNLPGLELLLLLFIIFSLQWMLVS